MLRISFDTYTIYKIDTYSSGLAAVTHQLSLIICDLEGVEETKKTITSIRKEALDAEIEDYISEYSDTLKSTYDLAIRIKNQRKYESPKEILNAILAHPAKEQVTFHDVLNAIKRNHPEYTGNNLKKYLDELTTTDRGEILRYDKDSYTYHFSNPFLRAYSLFVKKTESSVIPTNKNALLADLKSIVKKELETARLTFNRDFAAESFLYDDDDL